VELDLIAVGTGLGVEDASGLDAELTPGGFLDEAEELVLLGGGAGGSVDEDLDAGGRTSEDLGLRDGRSCPA